VKTNRQAPSKVDVGSASLLPQALYPNAYDATTPARTATASHLRKPKLSRSCRECVHEVDSIVRRQAVCETTHPDRDGPYGHVFATMLGRFGPSGPGPGRARGSPHPRRRPKDVELRGSTKQREDVLFYVWV